MGHITLTTDFGTRQGSHAVMHGVISSIAPGAVVTDLTHHIRPQDIREAAFVIDTSAWYFPAGTVHVVVCDPGVGTQRRAMAAEVGTQRFVTPDNGTLSAVLARADGQGWATSFVHLDRPEYWRPAVSNTFHGRDVFAPVAAHLSEGVRLDEIGTPFDDPVRISMPGARRTDRGVEGEVIYIDDFGSAICSVLPADIAELGEVAVELCGATIEGMVRTFGDSPYGADIPIALWDSSGYLLVSENNGTGGKVIRPRPGDPVLVRPLRQPARSHPARIR